MKTTKILFTVLLSLLFRSEAYSQINNDEAVPKGLYFIVNEDGGALQPMAASAAQSVLLYEFSKSGMQKWEVIPQKNGGYLIKLYDSDFYLEPHPSTNNLSALLSFTGDGYRLEAVPDSDHLWYIRSKARKGDAMRVNDYHDGLKPKILFDPAEDNSIFKWEFIPAE